MQAGEGTASEEEEQREEVEEHKIHDGYALTPGMYEREHDVLPSIRGL